MAVEEAVHPYEGRFLIPECAAGRMKI
jgi:hypothetical protein